MIVVSNVYRKDNFLINDKPVEQVDNIGYFGTTIEQTGNFEMEIKDILQHEKGLRRTANVT